MAESKKKGGRLAKEVSSLKRQLMKRFLIYSKTRKWHTCQKRKPENPTTKKKEKEEKRSIFNCTWRVILIKYLRKDDSTWSSEYVLKRMSLFCRKFHVEVNSRQIQQHRSKKSQDGELFSEDTMIASTTTVYFSESPFPVVLPTGI